MRLFLTLVLGAVLVGAGAASGAPSVSLTSNSDTLAVSAMPGDTITVKVKVTADATALSGCQVDLKATGPVSGMLTVGTQAYNGTDWETDTVAGTALAAMSGTIPSAAGPHGTGAVASIVSRTSTMSTIALTISPSAAAGQVYTVWVEGNAFPDYSGSLADLPVTSASSPLVVTVGSNCVRTVAGRHIFYNNSAWDGNNAAIQAPLAGVRNDDTDALATDKVAYRGGGVRANFNNYISFNKSITGIMVDLARGAGCSAPTVTAADFTFKVGNSNTLTSFVAATAPVAVQVIAGAGDGGSDRVEITWATDAIPNSVWLQVTVLANANTGLAAPDVHYWGIAKGDSGTGNTATAAPVTATDELAARNNPRSVITNPAPIDFAFDYTRDRGVTATDQQISRSNGTSALTTALKLILLP